MDTKPKREKNSSNASARSVAKTPSASHIKTTPDIEHDALAASDEGAESTPEFSSGFDTEADAHAEADADALEHELGFDTELALDSESDFDSALEDSDEGTDEKPNRAPSEKAERLQKLLSRAGVASRRAAEELIAQGRVSVNGHVIKELGAKAEPFVDRITVDGQPLKLPTGGATVVLLHKPSGVVTTKNDPEGRTTVTHFLPEKYRHLHPIGRLDFDTAGVLFLTDDGDLTQLLTHPSHGVEKVYWARIRGTISIPTIKKLEAGILLDDGMTAPCRVRVRATTEKNSLIQIALREGRNRQVRRMMEAVGHPIRALRRVRVAGLGLEELTPGTFRVLLPGEIHALRKAAEKSKPVSRAAKARTAPKPNRESGARNDRDSAARPAKPRSGRADWGREVPERPVVQRPAAQRSAERSAPQRPAGDRPNAPRSSAQRATPQRFESQRPEQRASASRPPASRPPVSRPATQHPVARRVEQRFEQGDSRAPRQPRSTDARPVQPRGERPDARSTRPERPQTQRPQAGRPQGARPQASRSQGTRPQGARPQTERPQSSRPQAPRSQAPRSQPERPRTDRPNTDRPQAQRSAEPEKRERTRKLPRSEQQWGQQTRKRA